MRPRISPLPVLIAILLGLAGWYLYDQIEFYDEAQESRWSDLALRNPYLALERFMRGSGVEVADVDSFIRLDELNDVGTLFFSDAKQVQSPRQLEQVLDWLEVGGNVIYTASSVADDDDLLLQEFDVEVNWSDIDDEEREDISLSETFREYNRQIEEGKSLDEIVRNLSDKKPTTDVVFDDSIGILEIAFASDKVLYHPHIDDLASDLKYVPFSWSSSIDGVHMMQFEVGSGLLTIINDPSIWSSYQIKKYDHAYLLWLLSAEQGVFAILRTVVTDSLWALTVANASELLIAIALIAAVWIWHLGYRFGRLLPRDLSRTRAMAEHFSTIAHYLWHQRHGEYLITPLRQRVLRRASLTLGEFARADHARQMELIAERADVNPDAVARVFEASEFSDASFVTQIRLLKRIEQAL